MKSPYFSECDNSNTIGRGILQLRVRTNGGKLQEADRDSNRSRISET